MDDNLYIDTLRRHFGYNSFRSIQLDIVKSIANGHDTLGLMPTGGGKSITFQVPALTMNGVCLVVTPLISLMKDQVEHLKAKGIQAEAINSSLSGREIQRILDNAIYGALKFLYISPERISSATFQERLRYMKVCFVTIDEAHCISQWGYDFRPSYLQIKSLRDMLPENTPVLALTATATPAVVKDIQKQLGFGEYTADKEAHLFKMSFHRQNLAYVVRHTEDKTREMLHILNSVSGSAIVFTRNRRNTKLIAQSLVEEGITATFYHAGLDTAVKDQRQEMWQQDKVRVMVATNAFGMGIDKPDVRLVIHYDIPSSLEEYFQEAGRGGRDGKLSYAILLHKSTDTANLKKRVDEAFPPKDYIREVYDHLAYYFELATECGEGACYLFDEQDFCWKFKHSINRLHGALAILQNSGYIIYNSDPSNHTMLKMAISREDLYKLQNLSAIEENVLVYILRLYAGIFSDYEYISEEALADLCKTDRQHVCIAIKSLAQRGVWKYIPPRDIPQIKYTRQRVLSKRLVFPPEAYDTLKNNLTHRIKKVIEYIDIDWRCRSEILLDYFGEKSHTDCGHCDVCCQKDKSKRAYRNAKRIMMLLSDYERHNISELNTFNLSEEDMCNALNLIRDDDEVKIDGPMLYIEHK